MTNKLNRHAAYLFLLTLPSALVAQTDTHSNNFTEQVKKAKHYQLTESTHAYKTVLIDGAS